MTTMALRLRGGTPKPKMFVRRQDKNNLDYYTYNNRPFQAKQPAERELFAINDLLMDLDDETCRHVRPFTEEDEPGMEKRWQTTPAARAIRTWSEVVERQLYSSRRKEFNISKGPASQWAPTTRDILSAAFRGSPASNAPTTQSQDGGDLSSSPDGLLSRDPSRIKILCQENGFPKQAVSHDHVLLDTLRRRQLVLQSRREMEETAFSPNSLNNSLRQQTSISGIRRVVFHAISAGLQVNNFQDTIAPNIRAVCLDVLEQTGKNDDTRLQALIFLGNLQMRLASSGSHIGAPLCGLGLRLSAEVASPAATLEHLTTGFTHDLWDNDSGLMEDLTMSLETYESHLTRPAGQALADLDDRGSLLLHALTGAEWAGHTNENSVRALLVLDLNSDSAKKQTRLLHETYTTLVGRIAPGEPRGKSGV